MRGNNFSANNIHEKKFRFDELPLVTEKTRIKIDKYNKNILEPLKSSKFSNKTRSSHKHAIGEKANHQSIR